MDRDWLIRELFAETMRIVELETRIKAQKLRVGGLADLSILVTLNEQLSTATRNCEFLKLKILAAR
jgi:hypothetical protein